MHQIKDAQHPGAETARQHWNLHAAAFIDGLRIVRGLENAFTRGAGTRSRKAQVLDTVTSLPGR